MANGKKAVDKGIQASDIKQEELEEIMVGLSNQGMTPAEIGMVLRDQHNVPSVKKLTGMNLEQLLAKKGVQSDIPRDLLNLIKKSVMLFRHMSANKKDMTAKRGHLLTVSKIRRLTKYYIRAKKLPKGWRYTQEAAELLVK